MNRNEFFNTLFANLPKYTKEEQDEIRTYYDELISDGIEAGLDEAEVISKLDTPENIAHSLNAEYGKMVNVARIQSPDSGVKSSEYLAVNDDVAESPDNLINSIFVQASKINQEAGSQKEIGPDLMAEQSENTLNQKINSEANIQATNKNTDNNMPNMQSAINHIFRNNQQSSSDYASIQPIHTVILSARNRGFSVGVSEDDLVHVYCEQDEFDEIICYEKEGTFFFAQNNRKNLRFFLGFGNRVSSNIIVKLPKSVQQAEVTTTNSSIHMTAGLTLDVLKAQTKNSGITCRALMCGQLELITTNSGIKCEQINAQNIHLMTTNSSVKLKEVSAQNELRVKTSNASIHFENIEANSINFETTNSGIKGTLPGRAEDYTIRSHTSNGKNTLPEAWNADNPSAKQLSVYTSNGSIKIFFE